MTAADDLTITTAKQSTLDEIKEDLKQIFKMKYLGDIHWLLNLKRDWHCKTITVSQSTYIERIIKQLNLQDAKAHTMPLDHNIKLTKDQCP